MSRYSYFPPYTSNGDLELRADKAVHAARQKGKKWNQVKPLDPRSRILCQSWWGKAWCENLERYADYENRLPRGKRYVKCGCVLDLKIDKGKVEALVQGSSSKPYSITVQIDPLSEDREKEILEKTSSRIENLESLLRGDFPEDCKKIFFEKDGLFPSPKEIHFDCSCPDWATMCKHVAASLYAVGIQLDHEPAAFFTLRGIEIDAFVDQLLRDRVGQMLENANARSSRIIEDADIAGLFGISM